MCSLTAYKSGGKRLRLPDGIWLPMKTADQIKAAKKRCIWGVERGRGAEEEGATAKLPTMT